MLHDLCCQLLVSISMIRIGIICPSEIAFRRFMPALQKVDNCVFAAIAIASPQEWFNDISIVSSDEIASQQDRELTKAQGFIDQYGGEVIVGYEHLVSSNKIDAVYIPIPPALHYHWAKMALVYGKHVFVEKPSTTSLAETDELIAIASKKSLALHENYMFVYHDQIKALDDVVKSGEIGDVRLYRITFGFPRRSHNDFRYNLNLGGGALLDAGGYCIKYANYLLGDTAKIVTAKLNYLPEYDVDMYGSATMVNDQGLTVQLAFGMDNDYKCEIEIWGSRGTITSNRILTAPVGFEPTFTIKKNQEYETRTLPKDDTFLKSIRRFENCVNDDFIRKQNYSILHKQEFLLDQFMSLCSL